MTAILSYLWLGFGWAKRLVAWLLKNPKAIIATGVVILGLLAWWHDKHQRNIIANQGTRIVAFEDAEAARKRLVSVTLITQGEIRARIEAQAAAHQENIRIVTKTIIKEVPVLVTPETDNRFPVPVGVVRVLDAAALGTSVASIPVPTGKTDGDASDVKASEVASNGASNYGSCNATRVQLIDLQEWIKQNLRASTPSSNP